MSGHACEVFSHKCIAQPTLAIVVYATSTVASTVGFAIFLVECLRVTRGDSVDDRTSHPLVATSFPMQVTGGCSSGGDAVSQPDSADDSGSGDDSSGSPEDLSATPSAAPSASPGCDVGGTDSSGSSTQFLAKGTSAGTITQGRCFQLFGGCLPNQCGNSQKPEDICNSQHAQCAGSCTVVCTDACSNT